MSDEKIVLIARLKVREGKTAEAKEIIMPLVEPSRSEEGCLNYDVHQAIDDENVFVWHETWSSQAALDEHFEKSYFKEFYSKAMDIAAEEPQIILTKKIS